MTIKVTRDNIPDVIDMLRADLMRSALCDTVRGTGVSHSTITKFRKGITKFPQLRTFLVFCDYYGYEVDLAVPRTYLKEVANG